MKKKFLLIILLLQNGYHNHDTRKNQLKLVWKHFDLSLISNYNTVTGKNGNRHVSKFFTHKFLFQRHYDPLLLRPPVGWILEIKQKITLHDTKARLPAILFRSQQMRERQNFSLSWSWRFLYIIFHCLGSNVYPPSPIPRKFMTGLLLTGNTSKDSHLHTWSPLEWNWMEPNVLNLFCGINVVENNRSWVCVAR